MASASPSYLKIVHVRQDADLQRYRDEEEFRHRMKVNFAGAVVLLVLLTFGIWLANEMVEAHKVQGCYASGVHSCSLI